MTFCHAPLNDDSVAHISDLLRKYIVLDRLLFQKRLDLALLKQLHSKMLSCDFFLLEVLALNSCAKQHFYSMQNGMPITT